MSNKQDAPVGLAFREKSLWITMITTLLVYAYYFWRVVQIGDGDPRPVGVLFVQTVIAMIVVQIVAHVMLAIRRRPEVLDERDRRIALVSTRNSYFVMMTGVWCALGVGAMSFGTFWIAHVALLAIIVAELVRWGTQLVYYRRGLQP